MYSPPRLFTTLSRAYDGHSPFLALTKRYPSPTMPPTLPSKLQLRILRLALASPPSRAKQHTRLALQRVCKAWQAAIGRWTEVEAFSLAQVIGLNRVLLNQRLVGDARLQVRALHVELAEEAADERTSQKVTVLLNPLTGLARVSFALVRGGLVPPSARDGDDCLGHAVRVALLNHKRITHFRLEGLSPRPKVQTSTDHLYPYVRLSTCPPLPPHLAASACATRSLG